MADISAPGRRLRRGIWHQPGGKPFRDAICPVSAVNLKPVYPLMGSDKMRDAYYDLNKIYADAERQYCH